MSEILASLQKAANTQAVLNTRKEVLTQKLDPAILRRLNVAFKFLKSIHDMNVSQPLAENKQAMEEYTTILIKALATDQYKEALQAYVAIIDISEQIHKQAVNIEESEARKLAIDEALTINDHLDYLREKLNANELNVQLSDEPVRQTTSAKKHRPQGNKHTHTVNKWRQFTRVEDFELRGDVKETLNQIKEIRKKLQTDHLTSTAFTNAWQLLQQLAEGLQQDPDETFTKNLKKQLAPLLNADLKEKAQITAIIEQLPLMADIIDKKPSPSTALDIARTIREDYLTSGRVLSHNKKTTAAKALHDTLKISPNNVTLLKQQLQDFKRETGINHFFTKLRLRLSQFFHIKTSNHSLDISDRIEKYIKKVELESRDPNYQPRKQAIHNLLVTLKYNTELEDNQQRKNIEQALQDFEATMEPLILGSNDQEFAAVKNGVQQYLAAAKKPAPIFLTESTPGQPQDENMLNLSNVSDMDVDQVIADLERNLLQQSAANPPAEKVTTEIESKPPNPSIS